jgi:hypothetical protein
MPNAVEFVAIVACAMYSGAAVYVTLVEHPARLACATEMAWAQWTQSVRRTPRYAALTLVAATAGLVQGRLTIGCLWTYGSIILLAVVPFTVIAMLPTQRRLTAPTWDPASVETRAMLEQWGRRHAVRGWLGLAALSLFLWAAFNAA